MRFALFYEIPVARPWGPESELLAYRNPREQAVLGDEHGWHAFWTIERMGQHGIPEFS